MENGELLLITMLMCEMLMWCADSLDMILDVRILYSKLTKYFNFTLKSHIDGLAADVSLYGAVFGVGSGPIHMNYLICNGTEYKLVDCGYQNSTYQHNEDWSVTCKNGNY